MFTMEKTLKKFLSRICIEDYYSYFNSYFVLSWIIVIFKIITSVLILKCVIFFEVWILLFFFKIVFLIFKNKSTLAFQELGSWGGLFLIICIMFHEFTFWGQVFNILCLCFSILYVYYNIANIQILCNRKAELKFDSNTLIFKVIKYFNFKLSLKYATLFNIYIPKVAYYAASIAFLTIYIILGIFVLNLQKITFVKYFIFSVCGWFVGFGRSMQFLSKIDSKLFKLLLDYDLICCGWQQVAKKVAIATGVTGLFGISRIPPKTFDALDSGGARVIDSVSKGTAKVIDSTFDQMSKGVESSGQAIGDKVFGNKKPDN